MRGLDEWRGVDEVETLRQLPGQSSVRKREDTLSCDLELALTCMGYFWASSSKEYGSLELWQLDSNLDNTAAYLMYDIAVNHLQSKIRDLRLGLEANAFLFDAIYFIH